MKERKISITPKDEEGKRTVEEIARIIAAAVKRLAALRPPSGTNCKNILQETGYKDVIVL